LKGLHVRAYATNSDEKTGYGDDRSFTTSTPPSDVFYVSKTNSTCGDNSPCYSTIQAALNAANDGDLIKVSKDTYDEAPTWSATGTVTISGGWNDTFSSRTGTTKTFAPAAPGDGTLKVEPNMQVVPRP